MQRGEKDSDAASAFNRTELIILCRACGLGGDRTYSKEELIEALHSRKKLENNIEGIKKKLLAFMAKRWEAEHYRYDCPAREAPDNCMFCSDGQILACYLFGNNQEIIDEVSNGSKKSE